MLSYGKLLDDFAAALADDSHMPVGVADATRANIAIYQNNVRVNRIAALADAFTNTGMLVGSEYFRALARQYVVATPAPSANLHDDGAAFPAFIRNFAPAAGLPYLADVAEVDWLMRRVYYAPDVAPLDPAELAVLGPARFAAATLRLVTGCRHQRTRPVPRSIH